MDNVTDALRSLTLWTKEDNSRILRDALLELPKVLQGLSDPDLVKTLCEKHLNRLAFYRHLVHHYPTESSDTAETCSIESEIIMKDIDILLGSRPPLGLRTLILIHNLDKRLESMLDEE